MIKILTFVFLLTTSVIGKDDKRQFTLTASGKGSDYFREKIMYGSGGERSPVTIVCSTTQTHVYPVWLKGGETGVELCEGGESKISIPGIACQSAEGSSSLTLQLLNADTAGNYTCHAKHENHRDQFGASHLSVFLKDDKITESESVDLEKSNTTTFTVSCSPKAALTGLVGKPMWYHNGRFIDKNSAVDHLVFSEDHQSITVKEAGRRNAGVYMCVLKQEKSNGIVLLRSFIDVFSPPYIHNDKKGSSNSMEGDTAKLICKAYGHPAPKLTWEKKLEDSTKLIPKYDIHHHYELSPYNGINNGTLSIKNLVFDDRADYVCHAENRYNSTSHEVSLRVKGKLAALWPFLGIVVEVVVLVLIIFLYERHQKRKQAREDEPEDLVEQKQALTPGEDLRQRKA